VPESPFADAAVSFFVSGLGLVRGEQVIVRVCVSADRSIVSSAVVQSSGDPRFDQLALGWARQVRLREPTAREAPVAPCGAVRVQMRRAPDEPVTGTRDNLLG
jgi:TonB family protein